MIARAAEVPGFGSQVLRRAGFTRITANSVNLAPGEISGAVGVVEFGQADGTPVVWSFVDTSRPAPRHDHGMGVEVAFAGASGESDVDYILTTPGTFEGVLNGLVQSTKAEHERRFPGCSDVWLTGFRNAHLVTRGSVVTSPMSLRLHLIRRMGQTPQFQTYWTFTLAGAPGSPPQSGALSFAYKLQAHTHVG